MVEFITCVDGLPGSCVQVEIQRGKFPFLDVHGLYFFDRMPFSSL
jgi:hypothetical protein